MSSSFFISTNLLEKLTNATITPTPTLTRWVLDIDNQQPSVTQEVKEQTIDRNNCSTDSSEKSFYSSPSLDAMTINNTLDDKQQYSSSQSRRSSSSSSIYGYGDDIPSRVVEAMKFDNILSSITSTSKTDVKKRVMNDMSRLSGIKSKKE